MLRDGAFSSSPNGGLVPAHGLRLPVLPGGWPVETIQNGSVDELLDVGQRLVQTAAARIREQVKLHAPPLQLVATSDPEEWDAWVRALRSAQRQGHVLSMVGVDVAADGSLLALSAFDGRCLLVRPKNSEDSTGSKFTGSVSRTQEEPQVTGTATWEGSRVLWDLLTSIRIPKFGFRTGNLLDLVLQHQNGVVAPLIDCQDLASSLGFPSVITEQQMLKELMGMGNEETLDASETKEPGAPAILAAVASIDQSVMVGTLTPKELQDGAGDLVGAAYAYCQIAGAIARVESLAEQQFANCH